MGTPAQPLLSLAEAADRLGLSPLAVKRLVLAGELPATELPGWRFVVSAADVARLAARGPYTVRPVADFQTRVV